MDIMQGMSRDQKNLEKAMGLANEKLLEKSWFGWKFKCHKDTLSKKYIYTLRKDFLGLYSIALDILHAWIKYPVH